MTRMQRAFIRSKESEMDLIPFMNLLAILIPVLLVSMHYIRIASIPTAMAAGGVTETDGAIQVEQLKVLVGEDGLYLFAGKTRVENGAAANEGPTIPKATVDVYYGKSAEADGVSELLRVWRHDGKNYVLGSKPIDADTLDARRADLAERFGYLHPRRERDYDYPALQALLTRLKQAGGLKETVIVSAEQGVDYTTVVRVMDALRYRLIDDGSRQPLFLRVVLSAGVM